MNARESDVIRHRHPIESPTLRSTRSSSSFQSERRDVQSLLQPDSHNQSMTLQDGRILGFAECGTNNGRPIIYMHGSNGSRLEGSVLHAAAVRLGARIISPERPGIGLSSSPPRSGHDLHTHATDVRDLANHLGIEAEGYGVLGVSAGGPHALACAAQIPPGELRAVSVACGIGPPDLGMHGMPVATRLMFYMLRYTPGLVRLLLQLNACILERTTDDQLCAHGSLWSRLLLWNVPEKDKIILEDKETLTLMLRSMRECFRHGVEGSMADLMLLARRWPFELDWIVNPNTQLWYATEDTSVPLLHGEAIAEHITGAVLRVVKGETHLSLVMNNQNDIIGALLSAL